MKSTTIFALSSLLSLVVSQHARADEFHFGNAETAAKMVPGSKPDMVSGVLLDREGNNLVIRVVGGRISVPRSMIYKIVKNDLSIADIETTETATKEILAEANEKRLEYQADEAAERLTRIREARREQAELDTERTERAAHHAAGHGLSYDPIIHRSVGPMLDFVITSYIQKEFGGQLRRHIQRSLRQLRRDYR